jgi:hypothetical protein
MLFAQSGMKRTSIAVIGAFVILASLVAVSALRRREHAKVPADLQSFSHVLATRIFPGDKLDHVEALLGTGSKLTAAQRVAAAAAVLRWQKDQPEYYADGVREWDIFLRWPIQDGCTLQLQFRNGRLINHVPESYVRKASE